MSAHATHRGAWRGASRTLVGSPALLACAVLGLAWIATLTVDPWSDESVGDLGVRRRFAALFLSGAMPYRDVPFEYPPLAAPMMALPGLLGTDRYGYWAGFAVVSLVLAVAVLLLTGRLAAATGGSPRAAMIAVALFPLLIGAVARLHFDLLATALTLAALLAIVGGRAAPGFVLLGLGAMTKGFPLVVAPVALAWLVAGGQRRAAVRAAAALLATLAAVGLAAVALSPAGALAAVRYHAERPVQIESTPATTLRLLDRLGAEPVRTVAGYGSTGVVHPLDDVAAGACIAALAGLVAALALLAARYGRLRGERPDVGARRARGLVLAALAAVAAAAALGKVLSPQFLLWVVPLPALAWAWRMRALAAVSSIALGLTLAEFPSRYVDLIAGEPAAVAITAVRNLALVVTVALAARELIRTLPREEAGAARPSALARLASPR